MSPRSSCLALALGLVTMAGTARAEDRIAEIKNQYPPCTKAPAKAQEEAARNAHKAAMAAFDGQRWDEAAKLWTSAYGFDCSRPKVFKNLGQSFENSGKLHEAVAMFELLMERAASEVSDDLPPHVHELRMKIEALDREADAKKPPDEAPAKPAGPVATERPLGPAPWIVVGVGGGALVAGAVLLPVGLTAASSAADQCADPEARTGCPVEARDDGEQGELMSQIGQGLLYGGAGTAALGLVLQFALNGERPVAEGAAGVAPLLGPGVAGVAWTGRF